MKIHPVLWKEVQVAAAKQDETDSERVERAMRAWTRFAVAGRIPARFLGKVERVETSVRLRSDVWKAAKVKAKERGMKLQDSIEQAIATFGLKTTTPPKKVMRCRRRTNGRSRNPVRTVHLIRVR